jgi:hypothetical protein
MRVFMQENVFKMDENTLNLYLLTAHLDERMETGEKNRRVASEFGIAGEVPAKLKTLL